MAIQRDPKNLRSEASKSTLDGIVRWAREKSRHNPNATTAPGVGNDADDGYSVGSVWIDQATNIAYVAVDVTVGAAVWEEIGGGLSSRHTAGWAGTCRPNPIITVTSNGTTWSLTLTGMGTVDLECNFAGVEHTFDTTPAASISLTAGTDTVPQANFIYLTESGGVVSINNSTVGYPATGHIRIADCILQSAASGQALGAYLAHQHSEHISSTDSGAIVHHSEKLRELGATWFSGVAAANMVVSAPDAYLSVASGVIHQLHAHDFPAIDMQTPATVYVVNDPTTPFKPITTLDAITQDAAGGAINNKHFSLVLWVSQNANDAGQMFINLSNGTYVTAAKSALDANKHAEYSIPAAFKGTGVLIAEYFVEGKDSGTWVQNSKTDLRGLTPVASPGGAGITAHPDLSGLTTGDAGHTQFPLRTEWGAQSYLKAVLNNTPVVQAVADSQFLGRPVGGDLGVITAAQARTVLGLLQQKVIEIGDWDMTATAFVGVAHGLTPADIRSISVVIQADAGAPVHMLPVGIADATDATMHAWVVRADNTNIVLFRLTGGFFNSTNYNDTSFNRGWVTIGHV